MKLIRTQAYPGPKKTNVYELTGGNQREIPNTGVPFIPCHNVATANYYINLANKGENIDPSIFETSGYLFSPWYVVQAPTTDSTYSKPKEAATNWELGY